MSTKSTARSHKINAGAAYSPVVIREATESDRAAVRRLAERDSARLPAEPLIVAVVDDELRAAVSVADGESIADPFHHSADLAALAEMRAVQLRGARPKPLRIVARTSTGPPHAIGDAA